MACEAQTTTYVYDRHGTKKPAYGAEGRIDCGRCDLSCAHETVGPYHTPEQAQYAIEAALEIIRQFADKVCD